MAKDYLNLNKVDNAGDSTVSSLIKDNTIEFFDFYHYLENGYL